MKLLAHPAFPPSSVTGIAVSAAVCRGASTLSFRLAGGPLAMVPAAAPVRTDGLWQTTCFELFVRPAGAQGYFEFNFAASGAWAAYRFDGYRAGMADLALGAPAIARAGDVVRVDLDLSGLPGGEWRVGISAVIEECDGTKSYWALAHPAGKPDFHDPACFALELPAASRA